MSEILPELFIGEYPRRNDVQWLRDAYRITAVHSLQDKEDLDLNGLDLRALRHAYGAAGMSFAHTPIPDGSAEAMRGHLKIALDQLHSLLSAGNRVYLHCNAGLNRAPTLAIAYLRAYRRMSLDEAMALVKQRRVCGPYMTLLEEYFGPRHLRPDR